MHVNQAVGIQDNATTHDGSHRMNELCHLYYKIIVKVASQSQLIEHIQMPVVHLFSGQLAVNLIE